jgi:hypothetical protein
MVYQPVIEDFFCLCGERLIYQVRGHDLVNGMGSDRPCVSVFLSWRSLSTTLTRLTVTLLDLFEIQDAKLKRAVIAEAFSPYPDAPKALRTGLITLSKIRDALTFRNSGILTLTLRFKQVRQPVLRGTPTII